MRFTIPAVAREHPRWLQRLQTAIAAKARKSASQDARGRPHLCRSVLNAGLVAQPQEWPGLSNWTPGVTRVTRPTVYFDDDGVCPIELPLRFTIPAVAREHPRWLQRLQTAIAAKVAKAHHKMRAAGRTFVGRAGVLAQSFAKRAMSFEPKRVIVPTVAANNPRARRALLRIQKAFRVAYRIALAAWKDGDRKSVFPFGTWWMRVHHTALSEPDRGAG